MVGLSALVLAAGAALNHTAPDVAIIGAALAVSALTASFLLADFRESPAGFPWPEWALRPVAGTPPSGGPAPARLPSSMSAMISTR